MGNWPAFATKRVGRAAVVMFGVVLVSFFLVHLAPGGPAYAIAGEGGGATPQELHRINVEYGLNQSLAVQFWNYLSHLVQGNFGNSYFYHVSVLSLIGSRIGNTAILLAAGLFLSVSLGTVIGVVAAYRPRNIGARLVTGLAVAGYSAPVFWVGILLIELFAGRLALLPVGDMYPVIPPDTWFDNLVGVLEHLLLPALSLCLATMAPYVLTSEASTGAVLRSDYVRTARAKGMSEPIVVFKHALRSALTPTISLAGAQAAGLVSGAVLVETVFSWPGIGQLIVESIERRDTPVVLGIFLISSFVVVSANVLTDFVYRLADPRIRMRGEYA